MSFSNRIAEGLEQAARWVRGETTLSVSQPARGVRSVPMHVNEVRDPESKITHDELYAYFGPLVPMAAFAVLDQTTASRAEVRAQLRELAAARVEYQTVPGGIYVATDTTGNLYRFQATAEITLLQAGTRLETEDEAHQRMARDLANHQI